MSQAYLKLSYFLCLQVILRCEINCVSTEKSILFKNFSYVKSIQKDRLVGKFVIFKRNYFKWSQWFILFQL